MPIRGRNVEVGVRRAQRGQLGVGQVADPDACGVRRAPAATTSLISRLDLGQVGALRRAAGAARRPRAAPPPASSSRPASRSSAAPKPWRRMRGQPLEHDRGAPGGPVEQGGEVLEPADGVDDPPASASGRRGGSKGRHGVSTSRSPAKRCATSGELVVGADGERVDAEPAAALRASRPQAEAVAVALGHRDEPGVARRRRRAGGARQRSPSTCRVRLIARQPRRFM